MQTAAMVKAVFSEFSYGFALTHELVQRFGAAVAGAPAFPSLVQEGRAGGYDVNIPGQGWAVFLQFKVSQLMKRVSAMHWREFGHPYFRFPIRPSSYSDQHRLLLELAGQPQVAHFVAYVAPAFHELQLLNQYFLNERVAENSMWVPVESIGEIDDNREHWVVFDGAASQPRFRSDESKPLSALKGDSVGTLFTRGPAGRPSVLLDEQFFRRLSSTMSSIGREAVPREFSDQLASREYSPIATCAYLARTLFDSELMLAVSR